MNCPHCHQEIDQPAAPDVREVVETVSIRGEELIVDHVQALLTRKQRHSTKRYLRDVPVVYVEKKAEE